MAGKKFDERVGDRSLKRNGTPIALPPKHFDLLVALVGNAARLIEKDSVYVRFVQDPRFDSAALSADV